MTWVVAYDISQNSRRAKIARLLVAKGVRLQKSVFLVQATRREVRRMLNELAVAIDPNTDQLSAWPLVRTWQQEQICFPSENAPLQERFVIS